MFGSILDAAKGGHWRLSPDRAVRHHQAAVLPRHQRPHHPLLTPEGVGEIEDFMPVGQIRAGEPTASGSCAAWWRCGAAWAFTPRSPRAFDYGRAPARGRSPRPRGRFPRPSSWSLQLETDVPIELRDGAARAHFHLQAGESTTFVLETLPPGSNAPVGHTDAEIEELFERTVAYWRRWLAQCTLHGTLA